MNKTLILALIGYGLFLGGQAIGASLLPIVYVKFGQRTIAVSDPNKRTLTIIGGVGELWICTSTSAGKTCKSGEDVINWITRNGDVQ